MTEQPIIIRTFHILHAVDGYIAEFSTLEAATVALRRVREQKDAAACIERITRSSCGSLREFSTLYNPA